MGRIGRSFQLTAQSYRILMQDKELMVLPLLSGVAVAFVAASFFFGFGLSEKAFRQREPLAMVQGFLFYVVTYAVSILDRKSTRLNSSHVSESRMPSSA